VTSYGTLDFGYPSVGYDRYDVLKFSSTGQFITSLSTAPLSFVVQDGSFTYATSVAVSPVDGSVAVSGPGIIQIFTPNVGRTVYTYSAKVAAAGSGNGQFGATSVPNPIAYDSAGKIYVADNGNSRIQTFTVSGATITYSAQVAIAGFLAGAPIADLAMSPSNVLHVALTTAVTSASAGTIRTYNTSLAVQNTATITAPAGTASGILTLSVDATGVWANWGLSDYLQRYTLSGSTATESIRWYSGFPAGTALTSNIASAADSNGRVIVLFKVNSTSTYVPKKVTSFNWVVYDLSTAIYNYLLECDSALGGMSYSYGASSNPLVILPAWSGDVWSHLKEVCAAYAIEIYPDGTTIRVADIGARTITLDNTTPLRVIPTNIFGGQQLVIVAQNPKAGAGVVFDANAQNTRFQIDVGQTNTVVVNTLNYPVTVDTLAPTDVLPVLPGQYYVLDSLGVHVPAETWNNAGASVVPILGDSPGQVKLIFEGPGAAMSGYTGPFTFADAITAAGRAALTLTGTGVFTEPKSYTFETGANPTKTTQLVAKTIDSFAINDMAHVARVAPGAIDEVAGYAVTVTFQIKASALLGFGLTTGSLFYAEDSRWRIVDVKFGRGKADVTAVRHVTLNDVDTALTGLTYDQQDAIWAGYSFHDRSIKPLALSV
jgi:hypothetical protein